MVAPEELEEIKKICPGAQEMGEAGVTYIHLPQLTLPDRCIVEAILCLQAHSGYATRLFLSKIVEGKGQNWTLHRIMDKVWHTPSWNHVTADLRPAEILAEHLRAYR
jgi:hypothetical protein